MEWSTFQTLLILFAGMGIFLRLVAKEKHRREKHLLFRLEEKIRKLREEQEAAEKAAKEKAALEQEAADAAAEGESSDPVEAATVAA